MMNKRGYAKHFHKPQWLLFGGIIIILLNSCHPKMIPAEVSTENLMETVKYFASPELAGRVNGSPELMKAAQFGADQFRTAGLKPGFSSGYFQNFTLEYNQILPGSFFKIEDGNGMFEDMDQGTDYSFRGFSGKGEVKSEVVFAGYGISNPELGFDEYEGLNVKGKIVLVYKRNPSWKINDQSPSGGSIRFKAAIARSKGAAGIIFAPQSAEERMPIGSVMDGEEAHLADFPMAEISYPVAQKLLGSAEQLKNQLDSLQNPVSFPTGHTTWLNVNALYHPKQPTVNVVGVLPGNDPVLKNEFLVIGAHMDHVGRQGDVYYPGANDNASGSAAVIELARLFGKFRGKLPRSVMFVLFDAEESGLKGAGYFVKNPPVLPQNLVAMFNFDCIAHGDSIQIGSGHSNPALFEIVKKADKSGLMVSGTWKGGGADATPFYEVGVPTLYFVTRDSYTHLHLPTDTPETLNPALFKAIVQLGFDTALTVAKGDYLREEVQK